MIKQQSQPQKQPNTWTFTEMGKKFTIFKEKNLFKFSIHNILAGEFYESEQVQLSRINERTIVAAFDFKVGAVTYYLMQKSQNEMVLQFIVKVEYLGTVFSQSIELKKVQMSVLKLRELQMKELQIDIQRVQEMIDQQKEMSKRQMVHEITNFNTANGPLFQFTLTAGQYLISLTGFYISNRLYNGQCGQYDIEAGGIMNPDQYNLPLILEIEGNTTKKIEVKSTKPNFNSSYEFPYSLSTVVELKRQEMVRINAKFQDGSVIMMNNNILTVIPIPAGKQ